MSELMLTVMNGAKQIMRAQAVNANNLANASTTGFRAEVAHLMSAEETDGLRSSTDFSQGVVKTTGRDLDISINGDGWMAIMSPEGGEAYTRRGDLQVNALGQLTDGSRNPVIGNNGPIAIPPFSAVEIGTDGTISIQPVGQDPNTLAIVDRIKLVLPEAGALMRSEDGLMRPVAQEVLAADASVGLTPRSLESSNVNPVEAMVKMIDLARQFESQIKLMQSAKENASVLSKLLTLN